MLLGSQVGYSRLKALILRPYSRVSGALGPEGGEAEPLQSPPLRIFMCLMDLTLEKEYTAEVPNQVRAPPA